MKHQYLLEWLDSTITFTLNPEKTDPSSITQQEAGVIIERIKDESIQIQSLITSLAFSGNEQNQLKQLISQYHSCLTLLIDYALKNAKHSYFKNENLKAINKVLLSCLEGLLCFIEDRLPAYLSLEERASALYICVSKRELRKKLDKIKPILLGFQNGMDIFLMLSTRLDNLTNSDNRYDVTIQNILYKEELLRGLESLKNKSENLSEYSALDEFLIYLNFNSKAYINRFTQNIAIKVIPTKTFQNV